MNGQDWIQEVASHYLYWQSFAQVAASLNRLESCVSIFSQFEPSTALILVKSQVKYAYYVSVFEYFEWKYTVPSFCPNITPLLPQKWTGHVTWPCTPCPVMCKCEKKKCFPWHFCRVRLSVKPPHESVKTFKPFFIGFPKLWCIHHHFVIVKFRWCAMAGVMETQLLSSLLISTMEQQMLAKLPMEPFQNSTN